MDLLQVLLRQVLGAAENQVVPRLLPITRGSHTALHCIPPPAASVNHSTTAEQQLTWESTDFNQLGNTYLHRDQWLPWNHHLFSRPGVTGVWPTPTQHVDVTKNVIFWQSGNEHGCLHHCKKVLAHPDWDVQTQRAGRYSRKMGHMGPKVL